MQANSNTTGVFSGKKAMVTGGAGGVGTAITAILLRGGCDVSIIDVSEPHIVSAMAKLEDIAKSAGATLRCKLCDASDESQVKEAVDFTCESDGRLDIAIAATIAGSGGPLALHEKKSFEDTLTGNVVPALLLLKHAAGPMIKNGGGSIVAISSINARFPEALGGAYSAGKAALDALVRSAARELGPFGIRVNSVRPGLIRTPATEALFNVEGYGEAFIGQQALKRIAEPADIADAICFLASPASRWITGQNINVDGGLSISVIPKSNGASFATSFAPAEWADYLN